MYWFPWNCVDELARSACELFAERNLERRWNWMRMTVSAPRERTVAERVTVHHLHLAVLLMSQSETTTQIQNNSAMAQTQ